MESKCGFGGASEAIVDGYNGFATRNDAEALAESALQVFSDDLLAARLSEGAVVTARQFGPEAMASRVLDVYREAMNAPRLQREVQLVRG